MNRVLIDILDGSGQKLGSGPIVTCLDWRQTARLNRAGEFSFSMPAADSRAAECRPKRFARGWLADGAGLRQIGMGRIERVGVRETEQGPVLDVSGVDLLVELADRLMLRTALRDETEEHPAYVTAPTDETGDSTLNWYDHDIGDDQSSSNLEIDDMAGTPFVIGATRTFHKIYFNLDGIGAEVVNDSHTITYKYSSDDTWKDLTVTDGTIGPSGKGLEVSGYVTFTPPSDWEPATGEFLYKVRIYAQYGDAGEEVTIYDIALTSYAATSDALDQVIAYAPAGWSLDAAEGYAQTEARPLSGTELLTETGFENYITNGANEEFTDWTNAISGTATVNADTTNEHGGAACIKLTNSGSFPTDYASVYQNVTVTPNTEYTLSFWTRTDGLTYQRGRYRIEDDTIAGADGYITNTLETSVWDDVWEQFSVRFITPSITTGINIVLLSPAAGSYALFDDISLQAGGGDSIYLQCSGESVLEMFTRLADVSGQNFILSPAGRKVLWLGYDERTLALRAVSNVDPIEVEDEDNIALITEIAEIEDASEVVTRVYPYGSGMGGSRVTLANATTEPPAGYTMSTASNYIQRDAAVTALGLIEIERSWADIVEQTGDEIGAAQSASNVLMIQAVNWLSTHTATSTDRLTGDVPRFYELAIAKCNQIILPGHKIRVVHHRWIDGYHAVSIDRDLWITAATWRVTLAGVATVGLEVATVPRPALNDALALATGIRRLIGVQAHNTAAGY